MMKQPKITKGRLSHCIEKATSTLNEKIVRGISYCGIEYDLFDPSTTDVFYEPEWWAFFARTERLSHVCTTCLLLARLRQVQ